jgi:anti-anti-sigma regulatory factor/DNA-directed RNA polymerase subunit RPC12/RpoP
VSTTVLHWQVIPGPGLTKISLAGAIDERADLDALFNEIPPRAKVSIDLSQVQRISSVGVRVWILFMEKLKQHEMPAELEGCSVVIVRQLNMISQFRGHALLRTAYAPYYCAKCNKEQLRLIDLSADVASQLRKPMLCPTCGSEIDLDDEEALYTELQG